MKNFSTLNYSRFQDAYDALVKRGTIFSAKEVKTPKGKSMYVLTF